MLPDMNGYHVCKECASATTSSDHHAHGKEPGGRQDPGPRGGADDYVTKPFSVGELVARIRAIFRRARRPSEAQSFKLGDATVNVASHTLLRDGKKPETLSFYEVELLRFLHERAGQPVSRDELLDKIWGLEANPSNRTIDNSW
jgi:DNA-binding response OmpR family regulator